MRKLDLGSGGRRFSDYETLDKEPKTFPDHLCNIEDGLPFDDNSFDEVRASHILEHIHTEKKTFVMYEIWRVLKKGGICDIELPAFPSVQSVQDPTHVSFWCRNSFMYYDVQSNFCRAFKSRSSEKVPEFTVVSSELKDGWLLKITLRAFK